MPAGIQIGRLTLGPPSSFITEGVGDPVGALGAAITAAARTPMQVGVELNTIVDGSTTLLQAQAVRRQLRSMLNNTPLKMQAFLYLTYSDDTEQNGWLVPQPANFTSPDNQAWKAVGLWQIAGAQWYLAGRKRNMREARSVWMKDLRSNLYERDSLGWLLSSDFNWLPALPLTVLPNGATQIENAINGQVPLTVILPTGRDGGKSVLVSGPQVGPLSFSQANLINLDLAPLSYERPESALNLSDVIVYDRRGQITAPSTGPDTSWEEVYGSDYPWNWLNASQPNDAPVLDNGLVRVRYDESVGKPGFRVDVWTGTAYIEQGKMIVQRVGDTTNNCDTWVSATLVEWTPDRAVVACVVAAAADPYSRERVYITLQRGEIGATFEVYPSLLSTSAAADIRLLWSPALNSGVADLNNSILKIDSAGTGNWTPGAPAGAQNAAPSPGVIAATAGTGAGVGNSGLFSGVSALLGNGNFLTSENWVSVLRYPTDYTTIGGYQATLVVQQAANAAVAYVGSTTSVYGLANNTYLVESQNGAGYIRALVQFSPTQNQQCLEGESMTLGTGTVVTADATASGGNAATSTRTSDANSHLTKASWPNSFVGIYRMFARVRVSANTATFYAKTGTTTGTNVTCNSTTYTWVDLGEITSTGTLQIHAWMSTGAGTVFVDRIEAFLVQDRTRTSAIYSGARDVAQAALFDARTVGALTAR